ncbi:MAG: hypothetical protein HKN12_04375 [Gemmatimonadetes bacterium]|nr:hypothetical protein [Gemmatimonadota bacterium]
MGVLHREARALQEEDPSFKFQRRLMDGGGCEASAFCAAGYRAGGVALPLINYHNMKGLDDGPPGIGPETIRVSDYVSEVQLLLRLAERSGKIPELERETAAWIGPATQSAHDMLTAAPLPEPAKRRKGR